MMRPGNRRRAFTLIEMTVVITILAVMAAAIMPNLVAIKRSRELREQEWALQRLPGQARDEARRRNAKITLHMDGDDLVLSQVPKTGDGTYDTADLEEIKRVPLGEHLRIDAIRKGTETIDSGSWQWVAYPDGSSDGAHLSVVEGDKTKSLVVPVEGDAHWDTDDEDSDADQDDERWEAGEVETRAQ
jgi:prepilin-type N-terminal cleavage/methylation domain-containing protein